MKDNVLVQIIDKCLSINSKASKIYHQLSDNAQTNELKTFWKDIDTEEKLHAEFWKQLHDWVKNGMLSQVFENPDHVLKELDVINSKINELVQRNKQSYDISMAFFIAFKLEFYLIHPAFETLFQYLKTLSGGITPENHYMVKINRLFDAFNKYDLATLELELLGETIHRLWKQNREMAIKTNYDFLTGALNRRGLFNIITPLSYLAQRNNYNVGIMMIDIDHFKKINDTFGHQYGDKTLKSVSSTIESNIRASDILGRYGGEEFLVFLSSVESESLYGVGEKIRQAVEYKNKDSNKLTISIGLSQGLIVSDVDNELHAFINKADEKLYQAKKGGRNKVVL